MLPRQEISGGLRARYLPYVYFLRFPLAGALLVGAFGPVSFFAFPALLRGIFDINAWGLAGAVFLSVVTIFSFILTTMLVLENGHERFFATKLPNRQVVFTFCRQPLTRDGRGFLRFYLLCGLVFVGFAVCGCQQKSGGEAVGLGLAGGVTLSVAALWLFPKVWERLRKCVQTFFAGAVRATFQGYLYQTGGEPRKPLALLPGHALAFVFLLFYLIVFFSYFFGLVPRFIFPPPTLLSVLTLLTLISWGLSGLAFWLDRFRVPVLLPVAAVLAFSAQWPESDYTFRSAALSAPRVPVTPGDVVGNSDTPIVVVCASGGGIQAGAWAAQVLYGLEEHFQSRPMPFSRMVRLISSVSGGSVGTLYYSHAFQKGQLDRSQKIVDAAMESSLDYAALGLVYNDLVRSTLPPLGYLRDDRGRLLERAWERQIPETQRGLTLSAWREETKNGQRPAHIFNSTIVETGERLVVATVDLGNPPGSRDFYALYGRYNRDVRPVTAARLSATFPYVSPAAHIDYPVRQGLRYHMADGGYYDNDGISSAVDFLTAAFPVKFGGGPRRRVLLLKITGAPSGDEPAQGDRGWFFQLFAPVATLSHMRGASQGGRNQTEETMLKEILEKRGVDFLLAAAPYSDPDAPLSWHLLKSQKERVRVEWQKFENSRAVCDIQKFLYGEACK